MREIVYSTGIDIGTSTTQLVFSRLTIENLASSYTVPNISIVDKTVVYRSEIYMTPILSETEIDIEAIKRIVQSEYDAGGFKPSDLQARRGDRTGEMARKHNADLVLSSLSDLAGDFVVATAGPALESVLSAKGAGTDALSKDKLRTIANIDVGGGTSNIAVYNRGDLVAVACLDIGGRLICIDSGVVSFVAPSIRQLAERYQIPLRVGVPADRNMLRQICDKMANALFAAVNCASSPAGELEPLSTNEGDLLPADLTISGITFSGGVADCLYHPSTEDDLRYGDVGPILAKAILAHPALQKIELYPLPGPSGRPLSEQAVTPLRLAGAPFLTQWTSCLSKMCRSSMCCRTTRRILQHLKNRLNVNFRSLCRKVSRSSSPYRLPEKNIPALPRFKNSRLP